LRLDAEKYVAIARIGKPVGLAGLSRLFPFGDTITKMSLPNSVFIGNNHSVSEYELISLKKIDDKMFRVAFSGISARDAADLLKNHFLYLAKEELPPTDNDEFYFYQLDGLSVETETGEAIGVVAEVFNFPTTDALEVKLNSGKKVLVPFRANTVVAVLLDDKKVILDSETIEDLL
jgi:16S rRNA processing protein RimM